MGVNAYSYSDRHPGGDARATIGDGMRVRHGCRALTAVALMGTLIGAAIVTTSASAGAAATASTAPGVTSNSITVGTISTQTGTLASNFSSMIYGERAYYNYINAQGGVNGRKIDYKYALDDAGNPTTFNQLANTLINQDHVFAVTGVATAFFSPNLFVESGIPTYGYNVTGNWAGPQNLFAAGGSVQYYPAAGPQVAYVARKTQKKPSIAFIAYGVAASAASCQSEQNSLKAAGYTVSYSDLKVNYPGLHGGHGRAAHEAGRLQHGRELYGRAGQCHHGQGDQAVRVEQHDPAVVQRERPVHTRHEPEPDAGRLLRHRACPVHGVPEALPGSEALLRPNEEVRAEVRHGRARSAGMGVGRLVRPGRQDGRRQPHPGQRDRHGQFHRRRSRPAA